MKKLCDIKVGSTKYTEQSYADVLAMLSSGVLPFYSLASKAKANQWQGLLSFDDFGSFLANKLMLASNGYSYDSLFNHWYIKDGSRSFGPFSLLQMLEFFHQKRLHFDNLVRHPSSDRWEAFAHCGPFEVKSLEALIACQPIKDLITRRQNPRIQYDNEVFVSAAAELYRGVTWSLSAKGLGMVTDQSTIIADGQRLNIIINSNHEHGAIQVKGRVVSLHKEINYERVAIEFDCENEMLNQYIDQRVPKL